MTEPVWGVALTLALMAFCAGWGWRLAPSVSPWPTVIAAMLIPFALPLDWTYVRILSLPPAVSAAMKAWEHARGRSPASMVGSLPRFVFWLFIPPDSRPAEDEAAASLTRRRGWRRVARLLGKVPLCLALLAIEHRWPELHDSPWLEAFWALWLTWAAVSGVADLVSGLAMQTGLHVDETFHAPALATSPRDFWGRRWNRFVHRWAMRNVFAPVGGRRHPLRATLIVFFGSGVMHEYVVVAGAREIPEHLGWMTLFFALHGIAVAGQMIAERRLGRRAWLARPAAVALHLVWLTATAPLFFTPLGELFRTGS